MFDDKTILYLEDEPLIALDIAEFLETLGFQFVKVAYRLDQAEKYTEQMRFSIALLDINVDRKQTSLALGEQLAKKGTRVVFASGNSVDIARMADLGHGHLQKPFTYDALEEVLTAAAMKPTRSDAPPVQDKSSVVTLRD